MQNSSSSLPAAGPTPSRRADILVGGGGPGGSTIAALSAERGRRVVLLEEDRHPRLHIGESLLPFNLPLFERRSAKHWIERVSMTKFGMEFLPPYHDHGRTVTCDFTNAWDKSPPYSYQVRRSEFDHILLKNAAAKGAEVTEGRWVSGISARHPRHGNRARRGRTGLLLAGRVSGRCLRPRHPARRAVRPENHDRRHDSATVYSHFADARRLPGRAEGNISFSRCDHGGFWFMPLADGTTSIGAGCRSEFIKSRRGGLQSFFLDTIALCPMLERLRDARLVSPLTATR